MIVYSWSLPNAIDKVSQFLRPDFASIGSTEIFAALGQAFFSIGLGGTFVVVYAGYLSRDQQVPGGGGVGSSPKATMIISSTFSTLFAPS